MRSDIAELIALLDRWRPGRVLVAGDFMLDRYAYGNAERLSPDAPVPVLAVERDEATVGGAGHVARCLRALHSEVSLLGVVGADPAGVQLRAGLDAAGCDTGGLIAADDRPTTVKHNFVGLAQHRHPQKMFRVDTEPVGPISDAHAATLLERAEAMLAETEVLCLADYDKGVLGPAMCQRLIGLARDKGVPVLADPAGIEDFTRYRGATAMTPNRTEAARALGSAPHAEPEALARPLMNRLDLEALVLTLDKHGALLLEADAEPVMVPTVARSVYDVTGAGDAVLAMLAAARANGADWRQATELANTAAGIEVEHFGVAAIELEQVLLALLAKHGEALGKQRSRDQLLAELNAHRRGGKRIAFTNGCFDILHAGHVQFLRRARRQGDLLVVGVNSDPSITRIKGPGRPVNEEADRLLVLSELASVDYLIVFDEDTPRALIEAIAPEVLVKGADYAKDRIVGADFVEAHGGSVALLELVEGRSTSNIIQRAQNAHERAR